MRLLSTREAAARLNLSPRRVQVLAKSGRLKAEQVGNGLVFREADLLRFIPQRPDRPRKGG